MLGIARKNRSAPESAMGEYDLHERYSANRNATRSRFNHAQDHDSATRSRRAD